MKKEEWIGKMFMQTRTDVAKGASLLDEKMPNWYKKINLKALDMSNGNLCICGQLFGTYLTGFWKLTTDMSSITSRDAYKFGFSVPNKTADSKVQYYWDMLAAHWVAEVRNRIRLNS